MHDLVLLPSNACIVSRLCADLAALDRAVLARSAVILPTRRLVTFCLATLAEQHGTYEPPLLTTLDGFWARLCVGEQPVVDELHSEHILHLLLTQGNYKYLRPAFAHELRQFFNDVNAADLQTQFYPRIMQQLAHNPWLAEGEIEQQRQKYAELQQLFNALHTQLQDDGQMTRSLSRRLALQTAATALHDSDFAHLYVAAFTSVTKTAGVFLQKLAARPHTTFYFNHIASTNPHNPVSALITAVTGSAGTTAPQPAPRQDTRHAGDSVSILHFASPQVEITYALHHAQQLLQAGEVRPAEIAIVLSRDAFYLPHLLAVVDFFSFAKNIAVPIPLHMTSTGSFLHALSSYACDEFQVPAAIDLVAHPLGAVADLLKDDIITALSAVHCRGRGKLRLRLAADTPAGKAIASIEHIVQCFRRASWRVQLLRLQELLHEWRFLSQATRENFEQQSAEQVVDFLHNLAASSISATKCEAQEFWQFVREKFLALSLHKVGEPLAGVQILSLPEVRAMPFQHVLVVGCNEGFFPKSLPRDVIVSDKLKTAIGLSGWQHLEAMEDVTFHALFEHRAHLTLSYCSSTAERSRFIEKTMRRYQCQEQDCTGLALQDLLPASSLPAAAQAAPPALAPQDFFAKVSASSAENFIRCPLRHFLQQLGIAMCEVRDKNTPLEEGNQLHKVIETFSNAPAYRQICRTVKKHTARVTQLCELLDTITATHAASLLNDKALAAHLHLFAWPRLAEFVSHKNRGADYRELNEYELSLSAQLPWFGGQSCELHCKVDHIHEDHEHVLLLDYKRKGLPEDKELDAAIAMQLAFYAYALARERHADAWLAKMVTGYYSVLNGEFVLVAHGDNISADFLRARFNVSKRKTRSLTELVEKMHALLTFRSHAPDVYSTADPSFCSTCQFDDLCRKNDPALQEQIAAQNYLQTYLQE